MANTVRGEVAVKVSNAEYVLKFSTNAICELEQRLDKGLNTIIANMERLSTVRAMLWAGMRANHPEITLDQAGDMIDHVGMTEATEAIGKALTIAFPAPQAGDDPNVSTRKNSRIGKTST